MRSFKASTLGELLVVLKRLEEVGVDMDAEVGLADAEEGVMRSLAGLDLNEDGFAYVTSRLSEVPA